VCGRHLNRTAIAADSGRLKQTWHAVAKGQSDSSGPTVEAAAFRNLTDSTSPQTSKNKRISRSFATAGVLTRIVRLQSTIGWTSDVLRVQQLY
jgi:hypothetical protein